MQSLSSGRRRTAPAAHYAREYRAGNGDGEYRAKAEEYLRRAGYDEESIDSFIADPE